MLNSPQFLQQMSGVMSNPAILDQIIAQNPQLAAMGPQVREVFQSERFRELMSNPESLRMMLQMSSMMREAGVGGGNPLGGLGGAGGFPAPGNPGGFPAPGTPSNAANPTNPTPGSPPAQGMAPFASMFGPAAGAGGVSSGGGGFDPAIAQQLFGMGAGAGGGAAQNTPFAPGNNPFAALGGGAFGGGAVPADTRPAEERFQVQLQQLNDMGFTNASQNVRALLATAGNVHSAIEYILGGGGL
jgi:ubiquilin